MAPKDPDKKREALEAGGEPDREKVGRDARGKAGHKVAEQLARGTHARGDRPADEVAGTLLGPAKRPSESEDIFHLAEFNAKLKALKEEMAKIDQLKQSEQEAFVQKIAGYLRDLKFQIGYIRGTFAVERRGDHEVYQHSANEIVDLTEVEAFFKEVEDKLKTIKRKQDDERSLYEELETNRDIIRPADFFKLSLENRLKLVSNIKSWDVLLDNTLVVFDFGTNYALEYQIGLGDLMPPWIRRISLAGVVYERKGNQGFYNNGEYLPIFNGSRVTIVDTDEAYSSEKEHTDKFGIGFKDNDEKIVYEGEGRRFERKITRKDVLALSRDFMVDAYFLEAVLTMLKDDFDNDVTDDYEFLHIAARYIQNAEARFSGKAIEDNHYTAVFIAYSLDRFSLFGDYQACSGSQLKAVIERYGRLRGVSLAVPGEGERVKPEPRGEGGERGQYYGHPHEVYYEGGSVAGKGVEMLDNEAAWRDALYNDLVAGGVPEQQAKVTVFYAREIYLRMRSRMGQMYKQPVTVESVDGHSWTVNNNCVGHTMKVVENLPFAVLSGRQVGRKWASNFYWGDREEYLGCLVEDSGSVIARRVQPENVDEIVGSYLAAGECAAAGLWNHSFWIYKGLDGRIMICHSGADTRPNRIAVGSVAEMPPGYRKEGEYYIRIRGSKVNEVPLAYFLGKQRSKYGTRDTLRFVPLRTLVADNLKGGKAAQFAAYYEENKERVG